MPFPGAREPPGPLVDPPHKPICCSFRIKQPLVSFAAMASSSSAHREDSMAETADDGLMALATNTALDCARASEQRREVYSVQKKAIDAVQSMLKVREDWRFKRKGNGEGPQDERV